MRLIIDQDRAVDLDMTVAYEALPPIWTAASIQARCFARGIDPEEATIEVSRCGWPCAVLRGRRGPTFVLRIYFCFLDYGALVEVRCQSQEHRDRAWTIMSEARPEWSDVASLWQVFR